ncbi:MAG: HAMP domain-containing histidine kinase [Bacteroidetes bacterium]|nr:HAMP domain-containing histidine kinase [Bacteroidota bacterium]
MIFSKKLRVVEIKYNSGSVSSVVYADKDQLIRVFSNLLKNAIQSIPAGKEGRIEVVAKEESNGILVSIQDNGIGIKPDEQEKIFRPNFTTKSSGMGLGLAMVKNIIENTGGKIWFTSISGQGSTFYVKLPHAS